MGNKSYLESEDAKVVPILTIQQMGKEWKPTMIPTVWIHLNSNISAESFQFISNSQQETYQNQLTYAFRNALQGPLVKVFHIVPIDATINVFTEHLPIKLTNHSITPHDALLLLTAAFQAMLLLKAYCGPFFLNEGCLGFNRNREPKVWINPNYALNTPVSEGPFLPSLNPLQKIKFSVLHTLKLVNKACGGGLTYLEPIFQTENPTPAEALILLGKFKSEHSLPLDNGSLRLPLHSQHNNGHQEILDAGFYLPASRPTIDSLVAASKPPTSANLCNFPDPVSSLSLPSQRKLQDYSINPPCNPNPSFHSEPVPINSNPREQSKSAREFPLKDCFPANQPSQIVYFNRLPAEKKSCRPNLLQQRSNHFLSQFQPPINRESQPPNDRPSNFCFKMQDSIHQSVASTERSIRLTAVDITVEKNKSIDNLASLATINSINSINSIGSVLRMKKNESLLSTSQPHYLNQESQATIAGKGQGEQISGKMHKEFEQIDQSQSLKMNPISIRVNTAKVFPKLFDQQVSNLNRGSQTRRAGKGGSRHEEQSSERQVTENSRNGAINTGSRKRLPSPQHAQMHSCETTTSIKPLTALLQASSFLSNSQHQSSYFPDRGSPSSNFDEMNVFNLKDQSSSEDQFSSLSEEGKIHNQNSLGKKKENLIQRTPSKLGYSDHGIKKVVDQREIKIEIQKLFEGENKSPKARMSEDAVKGVGFSENNKEEKQKIIERYYKKFRNRNKKPESVVCRQVELEKNIQKNSEILMFPAKRSFKRLLESQHEQSNFNIPSKLLQKQKANRSFSECFSSSKWRPYSKSGMTTKNKVSNFHAKLSENSVSATLKNSHQKTPAFCTSPRQNKESEARGEFYSNMSSQSFERIKKPFFEEVKQKNTSSKIIIPGLPVSRSLTLNIPHLISKQENPYGKHPNHYVQR